MMQAAMQRAMLIILIISATTRSDEPEVRGRVVHQGKPGHSAIRGELEGISKADDRAWADYVKEWERAQVMKKNGAPPETVSRIEEHAWSRYCEPVVRGADRLLQLVQEHHDDEAAIEALSYVAMAARKFSSDQSRRAIVILLRHHVRAEKI